MHNCQNKTVCADRHSSNRKEEEGQPDTGWIWQTFVHKVQDNYDQLTTRGNGEVRLQEMCALSSRSPEHTASSTL